MLQHTDKKYGPYDKGGGQEGPQSTFKTERGGGGYSIGTSRFLVCLYRRCSLLGCAVLRGGAGKREKSGRMASSCASWMFMNV